ncbi:MAG: ABC transporter substrate-binding protein [Bacteroidia bacterium]|nr:ABC transporter substrate-binding protein [Bacteroidia bacterium]
MRHTIFWLGLLLLFSCKERNSISDKKVFRYNEPKGITSLDPAYARSMSNTWGINLLFNGLVQLDSNLQVRPAIAKSWTISEDGKTYRFLLRNDVFFHSDPCFGDQQRRKVNAGDFVYSFRRILDPTIASPGKWVFSNLEENLEKALEAPNDSVLIIRLRKSFPPFLGMLAMHYCSVVPKEAVLKYGKDFRMHPVGTGPFRLFIWKEGVKLVVHKNPDYFERDEHNQALPYLDAVSITFVSDAQSSFMSFVQGKTDFLNGLDDGSYKDAILTRSGELKPEFRDRIYLKRSAFLNTEYLGFLVSDTAREAYQSPVTNLFFRQAVNYALDRKKMIHYLRNNIGIPGENGLVPPSLYKNRKDGISGYSYNPAKAKELLQKSGYLKNPQPVKLYITAQYADLCEFIQHQLHEIGILVQLEVNPPGTHGELVAKCQAPFFRKSWVADYPDAENYLSLLYSPNFTPNGPNYTLFSNPDFDRIYQASLQEVSDQKREQMYAALDSLALEQAPMVVLYYDESLRFLNKRVKQLPNNPLNLPDLKRCVVEDRQR